MAKKDLTELQEAKIEAAQAKAEAITAKKELAQAKAPKGMADAVKRTKDGLIKRPDEIMAEDLQVALVKDPSKFTDAEKIAIERTIRRYVKCGGIKHGKVVPAGWVKGISAEDKEYATGLLKKMGCVDAEGNVIPNWDVSIFVPGMNRTRV